MVETGTGRAMHVHFTHQQAEGALDRLERLEDENAVLRRNLDALKAAHRELQQALREVVRSYAGSTSEEGEFLMLQQRLQRVQ